MPAADFCALVRKPFDSPSPFHGSPPFQGHRADLPR